MRRELQSSGCSETNEGLAAADNETWQEVKQSMHENFSALDFASSESVGLSVMMLC
jgi:hypothetical protein